MKKSIHPTLNEVDAKCVCGKHFEILSTQKEITVAFCSDCHPFYTNKQHHADVEGRIDKFRKKYGNKKYV
jgi:large subunit ribosomal protein L31